MSTEAVSKFFQKARQDSALQAKLAAIHAKERQATIAAIVKLAAETGFAFTAAEYDAAVKEELAKQHAARELSQQELEEIAGGVNLNTILCTKGCQPQLPRIPSVLPCRVTEGPTC